MYIYVKVHNRGWVSNTSNDGNWLHIYWAKSAAGLTQASWKGLEQFNGKVTGGHIASVNVGLLDPGKTKVLVIPWNLPEEYVSGPADDNHFCLLARIFKSEEDDEVPPITITPWYDVVSDKCAAQSNVSIIKDEGLCKGMKLQMTNVYDNDHEYTLEVKIPNKIDSEIFDLAKISLEMSEPLYEGWFKGDLQQDNLTYYPNIKERTVYLNSEASKLKSILMKGNEHQDFVLKFNFFKGSSETNKHYSVDVIQRDKLGNIVGGERFVVYSPDISDEKFGIIKDIDSNGVYMLTADIDEENQSFIWVDSANDIIGVTKSIVVDSNIGHKSNGCVKAIAYNDKGEIKVANTDLEENNYIESIENNKISICVKMKDRVDGNGNLLQMISVLGDGSTQKMSKIIETGKDSITLDITTLPHGIYCISYIKDGNILDSKTIKI